MQNPFKSEEAKKLKEILRNHGIRFEDVSEDMLIALSSGIVLNIFKFDDALHEKYGDYEFGSWNEQGKSMQDILREEFTNEEELKAVIKGLFGKEDINNF